MRRPVRLPTRSQTHSPTRLSTCSQTQSATRLAPLTALAVCVAALLAHSDAHAHFVLQQPENWMSQDPLGLPEKMPPCGNEAGGTPTGIVTPFHPGETITVTIDEKIFHPGHYTIALAINDRSELPPDPADLVTPAPSGAACGDLPIQDPPVFPVLADGVFDHTAPFTEAQSVQITLPSDVTCTHCTLQVVEFMSAHAAPCFYHHCADISILPEGQSGDVGGTGAGGSAASVSGAAGMGGAGGSTAGAGDPGSAGCSCRIAGGRSAGWAGAALAALALIGPLARRRHSLGQAGR